MEWEINKSKENLHYKTNHGWFNIDLHNFTCQRHDEWFFHLLLQNKIKVVKSVIKSNSDPNLNLGPWLPHGTTFNGESCSKGNYGACHSNKRLSLGPSLLTTDLLSMPMVALQKEPWSLRSSSGPTLPKAKLFLASKVTWQREPWSLSHRRKKKPEFKLGSNLDLRLNLGPTLPKVELLLVPKVVRER